MDPSYTLPAYERRIQVLTEEGTTIEEIPSDRLDPLLGDQRFESPAPRPIAKAVPPEEGLDETEMDDVAIEMIDEEIASGTADEKRT